MPENNYDKELRKTLIEQLQEAVKHLNEPGLGLTAYHELKGKMGCALGIIEWQILQKLETKGKQVQLDTVFNQEQAKKQEELMKELMEQIDNPALGVIEDSCALLGHPQREYYDKDSKAMEKSNKCWCCQKEYKES